MLDKLDEYYDIIQATLLKYQSPNSGLIGDGKVGFVRDTVYTAALINAGATIPTVNILKNDTGGTFTWSRTTTGQFVVTISNIVLDVNKVGIFECANNDLNLGAEIINPTTINVQQFSSGGGGYVDTMEPGTTIEFRIYS